MKKIIAAFDGLRFSESTRDYAIQLVKLSKAHLTGIFLDDRTYTSFRIYDLVLKDGVSSKLIARYKNHDKLEREKSATNFTQVCINEGIEFNIRHDYRQQRDINTLR